MNFWQFLQTNFFEILALTREHLLLAALATIFAALIGIPLGIFIASRPKWQTPVLGLAGILQTVPSLALFGLMIPLPFIGGIGAKTAVIALTLYSLLPIIRNTLTGILQVDPKVREAARAMGMMDGQILRYVELPLALPVILAGVRIAAVVSVGTVTVAAAVGAGGLGTYIFRGLRQNDNNLLLAGAIFSALLALLADFLLGQIEKSFDRRKALSAVRRKAVLAFTALAATVLIFSFWTGKKDNFDNSNAPIRVGSKDFTESIILAEILAQMLEKKGLAVERRYELGGNLAHDALLADQIDIYPEYTGTAFTAILKHPPKTDTQAVYQQTKSEYAEKFALEVSPPLGFSNDFAILIRGEVARRLNLQTISEAVPESRNWQAGFGQDFMSRADGYPGFSKTYNFQFTKLPREMDLSLTYRALAASQVDIIAGNSTDGLISALDLFQLADDKHYFPPYQAVFISRRDRAEILHEVFEKLNNAISTEEMRRLNYEVDGKQRLASEVVAEWLRQR